MVVSKKRRLASAPTIALSGTITVPLDARGKIPLAIAQWIADCVIDASYQVRAKTIKITYTSNGDYAPSARHYLASPKGVSGDEYTTISNDAPA